VIDHVKNPHPTIQHPAYEQAPRGRLAAVTADPQAPVHPLLDHDRGAARALHRPARDVSMPCDRGGIEMALWLDAWLRAYDIVLDV
jgi:hypothetical protein